MPIINKNESDILLQQEALTPNTKVVMAEAPQEDFIGPLEAPIETATTDTMGAYWRRENIFGSALTSIIDDFNYDLTTEEPDASYDPMTDVNNLTGYEGFEYLLAGALNEQHAARIRGQIDDRREDFETLINAPTYQHVLAMPLAIADPSILMPATIGVKSLKTASMIKKVGGFAAGGAAAVGVQEMGLQLTQDFRSADESQANIAAGTILGSLFGGAYGAFTAKSTKANKILGKLSKDLESTPTTLSRQIEEGGLKSLEDIEKAVQISNESVGAARIDLTEEEIFAMRMADREAFLAQETLVSAKGFEKVLKSTTPLLRNMQSPFLASRRLIQKFVNMPLQKMGGEYEQAITHAIEIVQGGFRKIDSEVEDLYKAYKKDEFAKGGVPLAKDTNGYTRVTKEWSKRQANKVSAYVGKGKPFEAKPLDKTFMTEVADAIENGNIHSNPYVKAAAEKYSKIFNTMADEALQLGVWSSFPNREIAKAYFTRLWDAEKVLLGEEKLKNILADHFSQKVDDWVKVHESKTNKIITNLEAQKADIEINKFREASYLQEQAEIGAEEGGLLLSDVKTALDILATGKPKKPKTLLHFIAEKGGINTEDFNKFGGIAYDDVKIWNKDNRIALVKSYEDGGRNLDNLLRLAHEEGFFPDRTLNELTVDDFVSMLDDELKDIAYYPKNGDYTDINDYNYFKEIEQVVDRAGLNPKDYKNGDAILTDAKMKDLRNSIVKAMDVRAKNRMKLIDEKIGKQKARLDKELNDFKVMGKEAYVEDLVDETFKKLAKLDSTNKMFDLPLAEVGPLKGLKLDIDNSLIKDYLVRDARQVVSHYTRAVGTDLELYRKFGSVKFDDIIQPLKHEFDDLRLQVQINKKLSKAEKNAEILKLKAEYDNSVDDFKMIYQLIKGGYTGSLYHNPDSILRSAGRMAKMLSYVTMMQGVTLSSIPDTSRAVFKEGFNSLFKNGLGGMFTLRKQLNKNLLKVHKEDLMSASIAMEHINAARAANTFDIGDRMSGISVLERTLEQASILTSKLTLMNFWNNMWDDLSGTMFTSQIGRVIEGGGNASDKAAIKFLGLDTKALKKIQAQWEQHATKLEGGVRVANLDSWTDLEAKRMYKLAMKKSGELIAIRKDIGDTPLFMYQGAFDVITQFKGFMFATMNKTFLAGLQIADRKVAVSLITMVGLGALTYILRNAAYGKDIDWSPENLLIEGIDRSGVLHLFMEASNIGDKIFGVGLRSSMGLGYSSKYTDRSQLGSLLGPSYGLAESYVKAMKSGDRKDLEKIAPFWRLFYVQALMQALK